LLGTRGQARLGLYDLDGALQDLDAAITLNPQMPWALASRSVVHLARRDVAAAIADRGAYLELVPGDGDAWEMYASMLIETGQAERLWVELSEALDVNDELASSSPIQAALGSAAVRTGRYEEAERAFNLAAARAPEEDFFVYEEARAMRHQGRDDEALTLVRKALSRQKPLEPDSPGYWVSGFNRALYLLAAGRNEDARRAYHELLAETDDIQAVTVALRELDELGASGHDSPVAAEIRERLSAWIDSHRDATS
jgi:tetratricopeptide (TPR) repeat protein